MTGNFSKIICHATFGRAFSEDVERETHNEDRWVDGLRNGHAVTFDAVYAHFGPRVFAHLLRLTGRRELADDLAQTTWLQIARASSRLPADTRLGPWIFTIARNAWRSERRAAWLSARRWLELIKGFEPDEVRTPDEIHAGEELTVRVSKAVTRLSPAFREAVLLVGAQGLEPAEAAMVVGISAEAFRQRLSRARKALSDELDLDNGGPR